MIIGSARDRRASPAGRRWRRGTAVAIAAACGLLAGLPGPVGAARPEREMLRLSDHLATSRSAHAFRDAAVRRGPSAGAPVVGRLHRLTEDGFAETYLLQSELRTAAGDWVQLRLPGRPNGQTGWVRRAALGPYRLTHEALVVDKRTLRITLLVDGRRRWSAPVGIGAPATPTPNGYFWVREQFRVGGDPFYGPYAFGTSAYARITDWPGGGVVGIHGTDEPALIPGRPSHGCIRLRNRDIRHLARVVPDGTPVEIR